MNHDRDFLQEELYKAQMKLDNKCFTSDSVDMDMGGQVPPPPPTQPLVVSSPVPASGDGRERGLVGTKDYDFLKAQYEQACLELQVRGIIWS